jgi:hypothetical protein
MGTFIKVGPLDPLGFAELPKRPPFGGRIVELLKRLPQWSRDADRTDYCFFCTFPGTNQIMLQRTALLSTGERMKLFKITGGLAKNRLILPIGSADLKKKVPLREPYNPVR